MIDTTENGFKAMKDMARDIAGRTDTLPDTYQEYIKEMEDKNETNINK